MSDGDLIPKCPNAYTLLSLMPPNAQYFTCLDLKGAFFCTRVAAISQRILLSNGKTPGQVRRPQLTWTQLPQGFKIPLRYLRKPWQHISSPSRRMLLSVRSYNCG